MISLTAPLTWQRQYAGHYMLALDVRETATEFGAKVTPWTVLKNNRRTRAWVLEVFTFGEVQETKQFPTLAAAKEYAASVFYVVESGAR